MSWAAHEIDGHDLTAVLKTFAKAQKTKGQPTAIVARTVKGYPIQGILSADPNHHGKPLTKEEAQGSPLADEARSIARGVLETDDRLKELV